ncbi:MAG TPA: hypothetical protein VNS32_17085 [Flavisolibacter sp.]|nr:hypothetical protein [Flavisolibacter sp.]
MYLLQNIFKLDGDTDVKITIALIAAVGAFIVSIINYIGNNQQIREKRKSERRAEIYKKLNDFYGPFQQYLNYSKELFRIFSKGKPKELRVLTYLLDPDQVYEFPDGSKRKVEISETDKELLKQIFEVGEKMEKLIVEKAGLVDDPELRYSYKSDPFATDVNFEGSGLLTYAKAHFQIIRLAAIGKFRGETERFKQYVFPRELNGRIEKKILSLQTELKQLNS